MISEIQPECILEKNIMVPMRDGVKLATDIYRPLDEKPAPVLLARLPYNKDRPREVLAVPLERFLQAGYAVVIQDLRGRYHSEGEFTRIRDEPDDGVDTIAWITSQPWASGAVGMFGASYLGIPQWLAAKEQPAALQAIAPMHCRHSMYAHQGGAFELGLWLWWALKQGAEGEVHHRQMQAGNAASEESMALAQAEKDLQATIARLPFEHLPLMDQPLLEQFAPYYFDWLARPEEEAAERQRASSEIYGKITIPSLNIGGWYDMFLEGVLENYQQMKQQGRSSQARRSQHLLIGPWAHFDLPGLFPERDYGPQASTHGSDLVGIHIRWFDHWLKGIANGVNSEKPVTIFVMGADTWRAEEDWPLPDTQYRRYYLHSQGHANSAAGDGRLALDEPGLADEEVEDSYRYDPRQPVPTIGGANLLPLESNPRVQPGKFYFLNAGPRDQRWLEERDDILCYTTEPLARPVEVTGPIELVLSVNSSAPDTDFTGKLVDVYPDGRAEILTDGILRARYREALTAPRFMEPEHIYELRIQLGSTSNLFKEGHRIRLEVSSSNFPRFNRNPNTAGEISAACEEDLRSAINRVFHNTEHPSYLILPIIERP